MLLADETVEKLIEEKMFPYFYLRLDYLRLESWLTNKLASKGVTKAQVFHVFSCPHPIKDRW